MITIEVTLLTAEQEVDLARRRDEGDQTARDELIRSNIPLANGLAASYVRRCLGEADAIYSAAYLGLTIAADSFDPAFGCKFSTHATWWIMSNVRKAVYLERYLVRPPVNSHLDRYKDEFSHLVGDVERATSVVTGGESTVSEADYRRSPVNPDDRDHVEAILRPLRAIEREIVTRYFGLGGRCPQIMAEIATDLGHSRRHIDRILQAVLRRLRGEAPILRTDYKRRVTA